MTPEVEQELAHTLLVELLAYQFASPVRWIETQDVILADQKTERIVEVGPADTLGGMAKRTLASKYEAYDAAKSIQRQILCYSKDAKEIYYDVDPIEEEPAAGDTPAASTTSSAPAAAAPAAAAAAPPPPPAAGSGPAAAVADVPVQAVDIVRSLIAQKLKKSLADVPLSKAIKDLVGGKSGQDPLPNPILTSCRQVNASERNSGGPRKRIWLDTREARRHTFGRTRCFDASHLQWAAGQAVVLSNCKTRVIQNARWLQYHSS